MIMIIINIDNIESRHCSLLILHSNPPSELSSAGWHLQLDDMQMTFHLWLSNVLQNFLETSDMSEAKLADDAWKTQVLTSRYCRRMVYTIPLCMLSCASTCGHLWSMTWFILARTSQNFRMYRSNLCVRYSPLHVHAFSARGSACDIFVYPYC